MHFADWDDSIHLDENQQKRIKSAAKADLTPIDIDKIHECGTFGGRHGTYHTTLQQCDCYDFSTRGIPCKHMYRLAYELGLIRINGVKSDPSAVITKDGIAVKDQADKERITALIDGLSEESQDAVLKVLLEIKNINKKAALSWAIDYLLGM